ncbi:uncharacterized protein LOC111918978 [Lactuca sativa]|uniref:DDE Tnp4 domain-containing protein n=1 Tax=Lactuca sativa TaxID=4236 RepID=A0A9R1XEC3_LACSA|nr:uncharacterized protein LOC111918978 [Lactuca sativa]KAJ0209409.1 hypothetical protein LSAT_V11C400224700 [Lactuca sativa]
MNIFLDSISSPSSSDDDELVMHTLLSTAHDIVRQRGEFSNVEKKRRKSINQDREAANELLVHDYFNLDSLYDLSKFEDHFRISRNLFLRIARDLENNYEFFQLKWDARGKRGFTTFQKCTAALRQLAYDIAVNASDEYLKMSARTGREYTYLFCEYTIELYGDIYLRNPTKNDVEQLYVAHQAKHGFPGMLGSIDCIHWVWGNCPNAWRGQFTRGDHGVPTVILEAVVSQDLWFWHAFFGMAGSNNDLNVLGASPLFNNILQGKAPNMSYIINGREYNHGYYLADGIYPEYATFVKSYTYPANEKRKLFKLAQESARKDVE